MVMYFKKYLLLIITVIGQLAVSQFKISLTTKTEESLVGKHANSITIAFFFLKILSGKRKLPQLVIKSSLSAFLYVSRLNQSKILVDC